MGVTDRQWLTDLYTQHSDAVYTYALRRVAGPEDAEDVLVEVFSVAWRRRASVPDPALPWLYRTAGNVIAHVLRAERRRGRLTARLAAVTPLHQDAADPSHDLSVVLDSLAPADAEILRLWAWEQLEPHEIATVLGVTAGAARTRLSRAKSRLRERYSAAEEVGS